MATLRQIAEQTGVSISTVSLVLNHRDQGRVNPEVAQRIRQVAQELGYRPNTLARSLRTNRSHILGFISDEIATTPYAGRLILGAQDAARSMNYMLFTVNTNGDRTLEEHEIDALKQYGVEGFIYARMFHQATTIPSSLHDAPTVLVDGFDVDHRVPSIVPDERAIGFDATEYLIQSGAQRIAYIGAADRVTIADTLRYEGYTRALRQYRIDHDMALTTSVTFNQAAQDKVSALIEQEYPDGVLCFNDARAWYVYFAAAQLGLRIGKDLSVVGVDNHRVSAETMAPRLTTVDLPHYEMGYWGAMRLISMIEQDDKSAYIPQALRNTLPNLQEQEAHIHCTLLKKDSVRHQ